MSAWTERKAELVEWAKTLVNREDARGGYYWQKDEIKRTTRKATDARWRPHNAALRDHFSATKPEHIVGLHSTSRENTSRWLVIDIDAHDDKADPAANLRAAIEIQARAQDAGFTAHVFDSNGKGGIHVWIVFTTPAETTKAYALGKELTKGLSLSVETFPKQPAIADGGFGNWIRLPGKHHSTSHWHRYWAGEGWLDDAGTVAAILAMEADDIAALPATKRPVVATVAVADVADTRGIKLPSSKRTLEFLAGLVEAGERNDRLFKAAAEMAGNFWPVEEAAPRLLSAALACGLTRDEATATIQSAFKQPRTPYVEDDDPPENVKVIEKRNNDVPRGASPTIRVANCFTKDGGEGQKIIFSIPIGDIAANLQQATGGWPARVSGKLFAPGDPVRILPKHDALFAWMQEAASFYFPRLQGMKTVAHDPRTNGTCNLVTRQELFEYLEDTAMPNYAGYETLPHYPTVDGLYYVPCELPTPTGEALREFTGRLNAETELDRLLMEAALLTPGWGGPCGARPAFVFSSQHGRGSGKSKTAERIMQVWGGWVSISPDKEDWKEAKQRLMDDSALACRCVYIDNIRHRMSGADLESMITAPAIDAKKMYVGQFSRPNRLTFFLTANTPKLSQDLSDRSIPIKIGKQQHGSDWEGWVEQFLANNRQHLLSDIYARIAGPIGCDIKPDNRDRWFLWQSAILALFERGNEMAELIKERRPENDGDRDDAEEVVAAIENEAVANGIDPQTTAIRMSFTVFYKVLRKYDLADKRFGRVQARGWIQNLIGNGPLKFSRIGKSMGQRFVEYCRTIEQVGGRHWDLIVVGKNDDDE